jgi:two-component system probable response regulator PhcQ
VNQSDNQGQFAILFVDDEEKALKYFRMAYAGDFPIITASSVADAVAILDRRAEEIGVLITDQRMPGEQGVNLLKRVRSDWPGIVRMLTTAYSDLDDAIEAVNSGEILRYVTKPWDIQALRAELRHAMDFFLLRRERDLLMDEKFSVRQRLVRSDRLRDLIVIAAGLGCLRHAHHALSAYVHDTYAGAPDRPADMAQLELWGLTIDETRKLMETNRNLQELDRSAADSFSQPTDLAEYLRSPDMTVTGQAPVVSLDSILAPRLRSTLGRIVGAPAATELREADLAAGGLGAAAVVSGSRSAADVFGHTMLHDDGGELLSTYLIAWHHGGSLSVEAENGGVRLELILPVDPTAVILPEPGDDWLGEQFAALESWG